MTTKTYVGDTGTIITLDLGADVSAATVRQIKATKPDQTVVTWTAVASGTNSIAFTTLADSLDQPGLWVFQAYVELPTWAGHGQKTKSMKVWEPMP